MSIDRRLREGLRTSADALTPDPLVALHTVERKAQRQRRRILVVQLAAAAAAIVLVIVAVPWSVTQLRGPASVAPPATASPLAGEYVVDIGESTLTRTEGMVGRWIVRLGYRRGGRVRATGLVPGKPDRHFVPGRRAISCAPTPSSTMYATQRAQRHPSAHTGGFAQPPRYGSPRSATRATLAGCSSGLTCGRESRDKTHE